MLFGLFGSNKTILPSEAQENMRQNKDIILLDVRETDEYNMGHIKGAKLVPLSQFQSKMERLKVSKDTTIYIYCQSGRRSSQACSMLIKMGYTNIYNLGGIMNWPYEIVK